MTVFQKNIKAREKGKAIFIEPKEGTKDYSLDIPIEIENIISKSGLPTAKIKMNSEGNTFFIHSSYAPIQEAQRKITSINCNMNTFIIMFGMGLGYDLQELMKRLSPKSKVLVIESSMKVFDNAMNNVDLTDVLGDGRFIFALNLNTEQISLLFTELIQKPLYFHLASNIQFVKSNYFEKLYPGFAQQVSNSMMKSILSTWLGLGNSAHDTIIGLVQNFHNIDEALNNPGIKDIKNLYKDKPAIIVSAGPSLDKNIELLKEVEGKALILTCDASLRGLVNRGIRPDAVLAIERVGVYEYFFKNRDYSIPKDVVLVAPPLIQPEVYNEFKKNKKVICYRRGDTINEWINSNIGDKGTVSMGSSVANLAFGFALEVGANPIIFIGQDLAYSETGETHGSDINPSLRKLTKENNEKNENLVYVEDYNGKPIKSATIWKVFLTWFENEILKNTDKLFIDATEGGAHIKGTQILTFREAIDKYIKNQSIERLNDVVPSINKVEHKKLYRILVEAFEEKLIYFKNMNKLSVECLEDIGTLKDKYGERYAVMTVSENKEICQKLKKADEIYALMKSEGFSMLFFQGLFCSTIYEIGKLGLEVTNEKVWESLRLQEDFLVITKDTTDWVIDVMEKLQEFLKVKIDKYPQKVEMDDFIKL